MTMATSKYQCKFEEDDSPISVVEADSPKDAAIAFAEPRVDRSFGDWTYVDVRPVIKGRKNINWTRIRVNINHGPSCS